MHGAAFAQFSALWFLSPMEVAEQKFFMLFCIWTSVSGKWQWHFPVL